MSIKHTYQNQLPPFQPHHHHWQDQRGQWGQDCRPGQNWALCLDAEYDLKNTFKSHSQAQRWNFLLFCCFSAKGTGQLLCIKAPVVRTIYCKILEDNPPSTTTKEMGHEAWQWPRAYYQGNKGVAKEEAHEGLEWPSPNICGGSWSLVGKWLQEAKKP